MGLDTTHDCWHGAYSAFTRWRNKLAEVAGYEVVEITYKNGGFSIPHEMPLVDYIHADVDGNPVNGDWVNEPSDPLMVLICHSDCDGHIKPKQARALSLRLKELLPLLPDEDAGGHIGMWKEKTQQFIDGLELAVKKRQTVRFH